MIRNHNVETGQQLLAEKINFKRYSLTSTRYTQSPVPQAVKIRHFEIVQALVNYCDREAGMLPSELPRTPTQGQYHFQKQQAGAATDSECSQTNC